MMKKGVYRSLRYTLLSFTVSEWGDSNARPLRPERSALPTALHSATLSGATRNRTGDTRIFSPLLYQLSYGTKSVVKHIGTYFSAHSIKNLSFSFVVAKVDIFSDSTNFLPIFCEILFDFKKMPYLCTRKTETECSAVGSALRSGRRGRAFESPHSD